MFDSGLDSAHLDVYKGCMLFVKGRYFTINFLGAKKAFYNK